MLKLVTFAVLNIAFLLSLEGKSIPDTEKIITEMVEANKKIKSLQYTLFMKERINGEYILKKADFKIIQQPFKVYMKQEYPEKGLEILFKEGENQNKALININRFPYINFNFYPTSNIMRKGHHHSLLKSGFDFFVHIIEQLFIEYKDEIENVMQYNGLERYNDIVCYKLTFESPDFKYVPYTVKKDEDLEKISNRLLVNDYMVFEHNASLKNFESIKPGIKLEVPTDYAKKIVLYIEKERKLPVAVKAYDEIGLFHEYVFSNVVLNPEFSEIDFDKNNPEYGF